MPDVIQQGKTGLPVNPNEPKELTEATLHPSSNGSLREQMAKHGRAFTEKHDGRSIAQRTEQLYREALEQKG